MLRTAPLLVALTLLVAACSGFPALNDAVSPEARRADYPSLLPMGQLRAGEQDFTISSGTSGNLTGRVGGLRRRAARLKRPVIGAFDRARMLAAVARHQ
jgi:hypothetical protein